MIIFKRKTSQSEGNKWPFYLKSPVYKLFVNEKCIDTKTFIQKDIMILKQI